MCINREGCAPNRALFAQGQCLQDYTSGSSISSRSYQGNDTIICRLDYSDPACASSTPLFNDIDTNNNGNGNGNDACAQAWNTNTCDPPVEMTRYPGHCIVSDQPTEEYPVPMVKVAVYPDLESCEAGMKATEGILPADPQACISPVAIQDFEDGIIRLGSSRLKCEGENFLRQPFSDSFCTTQEGVEFVVEDEEWVWGTNKTCSEHPQRPGSFWTADCSYDLYCKDFYETSFAFPMPNDKEDESSPSLLDLYVFQVFNQWNNLTDSVRCQNCDTENECIASRTFFVEGVCMKDPRTSRGSRSFGSSSDTTSVCRRDYDDMECQELIDPCDASYTTDQCNADALGAVVDYFPNHCMELNRPQGEYTVTFAKVTEYPDEATCQSDWLGRDRLIPVDPNLCFHAGVLLNDDETIPGSGIATCTEEGVLVQNIYSDDSCSSRIENLTFSELRRGPNCTKDPISPYYWRANCSYTLYCKDLSLAPFAKVISDELHKDTTTNAPTMEATRPSTSNASNVEVVGTTWSLLVSGVMVTLQIIAF